MSPDLPLIGVVDIGKTHAKLMLVDASGREEWSAQRANAAPVRDGLRQLDVPATAAWLRAMLAAAPARARIGAIVPVAHGAAAVFLDKVGAVVAAPDYEDPAYNIADADYAAQRDPFARTFSPALPLGLNLGRQIHHLQTRHPALFARVRHILPYPQYWAWLLCGVLASEVTSLGCHTDLWLPREAGFSPMAERRGWAALFPPLRRAGETLGTVRPELARDCGLDPACRVLCGIHDSNASFLQHRAARPEASFTAISSGTWTVLLSSGVVLGRIDGARDMLANVDAFGVPVATARFMGGREYAAIAGEDAKLPTEAGLRAVLHRNAMALPSFAPGGPFTAHHGRMLRCDMLDADGRAALATLYTALVTDHVLDLLGATGEVIIDGPLAGNALYAAVLAALRPADEVRVGAARAGIVGAAGFLATGTPPVAKLVPAARLPITGLAAYRVAWRALIDGGT